MAESAKKIIDFSFPTAKNEQKSPAQEQKSTDVEPWDRQEDEPVLWHSRLQIYLYQGTKRSLKTAYLQEREQRRLHLVEQNKGKGKRNQQKEKPISEHVPGSWKQASIKYRWQERARAFDVDMVKGITRIVLDSLGSGLANRLTRIKELDKIGKRIIAECDEKSQPGHYFPHDTEIAYYKQLQSILHDIRREMDELDRDILDQLVTNEAERFYASMEAIPRVD